MGRCEVCETRSQPLYMCGFEDQPILSFCREHWIEHVALVHKDSAYAQQQLRAFKATAELTDLTNSLCRFCGHKDAPNEDGSCSAYGYNGVDCQQQPCACRTHVLDIAINERCPGGCGMDFAEFPEMRHTEEECGGPECTCYEVTGGHQLGCYFYRRKESKQVSEKQELTIQEAIDRGWVDCPEGGERLSVARDGQVEKCEHYEYWNLFIQTGEAAVNDNR